MELREPTGADIVSLLTMAAPEATKLELGFEPPATSAFEAEIERGRLAVGRARHSYAYVVAVAIYWSLRPASLQRTSRLLQRLAIPVDALLQLITLAKVKELDSMESVVSEIAVKTRFQKEVQKEKKLSELNRQRANKRHALPGGSHEMRAKMREIWRTGEYSSRDECALKNCEKLGISFSTARGHLKGEPDVPVTRKKPRSRK